MNTEFLKDLLQAALMTADEPLSLERLKQLFEPGECPGSDALRHLLDEIRQAHADGPVVLARVAGGYRFQSHPRFTPWLSRLHAAQTPKPSRAFLETLAVIAYRQPVTRAEIEEIRGVAVSSGILKTLQGYGWIRSLGHREAPGRPELLGTTSAFLAHFGLDSLAQLPALEEIKDLEQMAAALT